MAEKNSLWKNIRNKAAQNKRTGATPKKPTREMLNQERKIKAKKAEGGYLYSDDELLAEGGYFPTQGPGKALFKGYAEGGYTNPYNQYQDDPYLNYAVGGKVLKNIAAGAYGLGEGILDTITGGATDQLTDKGFEALTKAGNKNIDLNNPDDVKFLKTQQKIKGYTNAGAGAGTSIFTGNVQGGIQQVTKGLNTAFQATDGLSDDFKKASQGITSVAGIASGFAGGLNTESFKVAQKAGTGAAGFAKKVGKVTPFANQALGMIGGNQQPLWQQGQKAQDYLNSPEYLALQRQGNVSVNQGITFSQGGNITNNSLNLRNTMGYKKFKNGGTLDQHGINFISKKAGLHHQNAYGGVPIGPDALAEGGEAKLQMADGGQYIVSDQVDGANTQTINGQTMAERLKKKLQPFMMGGLASNPRDKENLRRPFDSYSEESIAQIKDNAVQETEAVRMQRGGALQYAANGGKLTKDIEKIVMEEYAAAYGGMLPNKYKGKVNMPNSYAKGGGIHIKESKKGTFTAAASKHGKGVQEFARQVLANKDNYSPAMVKKANFAHNAAGWKHADGGYVYNPMTQPMYAKGGPGDPPLTPEELKWLAVSLRGTESANYLSGSYEDNTMPGGNTDRIKQLNSAQKEQLNNYMLNTGFGTDFIEAITPNIEFFNPKPAKSKLAQGGPLYGDPASPYTYAYGGMYGDPYAEGGLDNMMSPQPITYTIDPNQANPQYNLAGIDPGISRPSIMQPTGIILDAENEKSPVEKYTGDRVVLGGEGTYKRERAPINESGERVDLNSPAFKNAMNASLNAGLNLGKTGNFKVNAKAGINYATPTSEESGTNMLKRNPNVTGTIGGNIAYDKNGNAFNLGVDYNTATNTTEGNLKFTKTFPVKKARGGQIDYTNDMYSMYAGGGPMVGNAPQAFTGYAAQNRGGMLMNYADGGMMPQEQQMMQEQQMQQAPQEQQGGQDQMMQMVQQVMQALMQGTPPEQIMQQLVQSGIPQEQAQQIVQVAMQEAQGQQQQQPMQQGQQQIPPQQGMSTGGRLPKDILRARAASHMSPKAADNYVNNYSNGGKMYYKGGPDGPPYNTPNPFAPYAESNADYQRTEQIRNAMRKSLTPNNPGVSMYDNNLIGFDEYGEPMYKYQAPKIPAESLLTPYTDINNPTSTNNSFLYRQDSMPMAPINNSINENEVTPQGSNIQFIPNEVTSNKYKIKNALNNQKNPSSLSNVRPGITFANPELDYVQPVEQPAAVQPPLKNVGTSNLYSPQPPAPYVEGISGVSNTPLTEAEAIANGYKPTQAATTTTTTPITPPVGSSQGMSALDYATMASQLAGPVSQFFQPKPKPFQYQKPQYKELNPTEAIVASNQAQREAQATADYNIKQNAPTSGSYLANIRGTALQSAKQRGAAAAGIRSEYDKVNFNAFNRNQEVSSDIQNKNIDAMQQDLANYQEQKTNALYNAGANIAGMGKDYKQNQINQTIANNIGTANWKYDQATNTIVYRTPTGQVVSVPVQTAAAPSTQPTTLAAANTQSPTVTLEVPYTGPMANYLNSNKVPDFNSPSAGEIKNDKYNLAGAGIGSNDYNFTTTNEYVQPLDKTDKETIKGFQDWLDTFYPGELTNNGKPLKGGKGYGNFGNQTQKAWNNYGKEFLGRVPDSYTGIHEWTPLDELNYGI